MKVTVINSEVRQGAKGEYLYIKYKTENGRESGKTVFPQLKDKWPLCQQGATLDLKLGKDYNVIDIMPITAEKGTTPVPDTPKIVREAGKMGAVVTSNSDDIKLRSMAIAYAKDLVVGGKIELKDITGYADTFVEYIKGGSG